ncbi:hypothetical protein B0T26DRAFT_746381 [Lasiosphaeria miniovina]|uniref:ATPase AAA-type core domain-containing protein n=1 Tax=Lasiosphaeria miniovina TaxID=1954250 RepID=A0AA40EDL5_9PEZI|nr:uncharacterized protein B0T26DRAFT_746381 [Lasiosphaeria miniovina]KAK0734482.1 hypothetical protein B0T26DRAFT_746381 [Lasiosphaeria miniovina]
MVWLKRLLRYHIPHFFSPEVLQVLEAHQPFSGEIRTTYDDVIIDRETKQIVSHLVSLSNLPPEMASCSLLKHIHIGGAHFYGPPGTGKTHLSRAVAKAAFSLAAKLFPCVLFIDEGDSLAHRTKGYSGSDLRNVCAEAAMIWAVE